MKDWCLSHPYMTFWLCFLLLVAIDNAIGNVCRVMRDKR